MASTATMGLGAASGATIPSPAPTVAIANPIPVPKIQKRFFGLLETAVDERNQLEKDGSQSHNIRRIAAYGALLLATLMYGAAVMVLATFLGFIPAPATKVTLDWHILATMVIPLFTIPTVLIIAVLKVTSRGKEEIPQSIQETLGKMVEKLFDKLTK